MDTTQILRQQRREQLEESRKESLGAAVNVMRRQESEQYSYHTKLETPLTEGMDTAGEIEREAPPVTLRETRSERKKREERESDARAAQEQLQKTQTSVAAAGMLRMQAQNSEEMSAEHLAAEKQVLKDKQAAIKLALKDSLNHVEGEGELLQRARLEIMWRAQADIARAFGDYARMLPVGSEARAEAMARKEKEELKADQLRKDYRVSRIANKEERQREADTISRHARFDALKKIFKKDNPLSHEDASWEHPVTHHRLVNVGRAFFGGTKPMYIFEDRQSPLESGGFKQYLFKEAVNCIGFYKPEGALVTAAAAQLQDIVCGQYSISAFAAVNEEGRVLGSFQEKVETKSVGKVDLYSWQADPQDTLEPEMKDEILREHTLDWLLCNFDTKGENFLHRTDGHLSSFDKEASFYKLSDPGSHDMSTEYKPHSNETLYNVVFTQFAEGKLDLDLTRTQEVLQRIEGLGREEYLGLFDAMLTQKYGSAAPGNDARAGVEDAIWQRKDGIKEQYKRFYGSLLQRRRAAMGNGFDHPDQLDGDGNFSPLA